MAHEVKHQTSLNKCILSVNHGYPFSGRMAGLEAIVHSDQGELE